ncbi:MAG: NAD(P)H-hydrate dehydratase [Rhodospirillales bacterium]|nr:NAD(P)H-hydrate dehydratase [Rhodospirillales bacterium]
MDVVRSRLPTVIYTADQVRTLDRIAIEEMGVAGYTLMCRAGEAAVAALRRRWPEARSVAVYCGAGNNAGDGYVVARLACDLGLSVRVIAVVPPDRLSGDAARAWQDYREQGGSATPFDAGRVAEEDILVDGLLGSGLDRELRGDYLAAVNAMEASRRPVLSLDIPTGLHADTGLPLGAAVHADLTVTFVGLKQGLFVGEGANFTGALEFAGLDIPPAAHDQVEAPIRRITSTDVRGILPPRPRTAHKGGAGSLLLVGGGPGMSGAIRLAAEAALRSGAGLVRVATHPDSVGPVMAGRAEVMCAAIDKAPQLDPWLQAADGVVLGPGLGQSAWARAVWEQVLASELPVVLDADGLNLLAEDGRARGGWMLTPHPGEAGRLLGTSAREIQASRLRAATQIADRYRAVVVLKGAGTLVAAPNEATIELCDRGNPGMATAGMGDVLAGILGGLLVQSGDIGAAARAGVWIHAACGDAAAEGGERGILAGDLMAHIRRAVNPGG